MGQSEKVVIVGSGCAGLSAAFYAARAQLEPVVIQGDLRGGLLTQTTEVENFPGFPEGIQGVELMDRMRKQAERFNVRFVEGSVKSITKDDNTKVLTLSNGTIINAKSVIIATGSHPNSLDLPGEKELLGGKGLSVCATCDGFFYRDETVCVIGGGDSACEEAMYLSKLCKKIYLVHRRDTLRASKIMAERVINNPKIEKIWNNVPLGFETDKDGFLTALKVENTMNKEVKDLMCKGVFLAIGWKPNTQNFKDFLPLDEKGYIKIKEKGVCTYQDGVFAAGDCVDAFYRQACIAAGMGAQAALESEIWLSHNE